MPDLSAYEVRPLQQMEEMNEWMEARNLSLDLVERTKSFYMLKFPTMRIFSEMEVLEDLDAGLRKEVSDWPSPRGLPKKRATCLNFATCLPAI
jgi:hypothetical protein